MKKILMDFKKELEIKRRFDAPYFLKIESKNVRWHHIARVVILEQKNIMTSRFNRTKIGKAVRKLKRNIDYKIESYYESNFYRKWYNFKVNAKILFGLLSWVNVYTIKRYYGGPEEGGWWYNHYECRESHLVFKRNVRKILVMTKRKWRREKYGNIYSVLGGQDIWVGEERQKAESETREKPYYC